MASFFKVSCTIFWLSWLFHVSYLLGVEFYVSTYIFKSVHTERAQLFIKIICIFNISYALIGCAFVKCNIIHILYAFCFIVPFISFNITASILGILKMKEASNDFPMSKISNISKFLKSPSIELRNMEHNSRCCGVFGFMDYAAVSEKTKLSEIVPNTCCITRPSLCNLTKLDDETNPEKFTVSELFTWITQTPDPDDEVETRLCSIETIKTSEILKIYKEVDKRRNIKFSPNILISKTISVCGCYDKLKQAHSTIFDSSHTIFYIVNFCLVALMVLVYIKNWCSNRNNPGGSEHSLDTDDMTALEIELLDSVNEKYVEAVQGRRDSERRDSKVKKAPANINLAPTELNIRASN